MAGKLEITALLALFTFCLSCGGRDRVADETGPGDTVAPTVVSATPAANANDVGLAVPITVTFSEAMDPASLTAASVGIAGYSSHGHVEYDPAGLTATVTLDTLLAAGTAHSIFVTHAAIDLAGNGVEPFTRAFQTGIHDCAHVADPLEPNDAAASATPALVGKVRRSLTVCDADKDIYRFNVVSASKITVSTPIHDASADSTDFPGWQIHYMREDGDYYATLGTSAHPGESPSYSYTFLPGTYFVEIYSSYGLEPGEYVLYDLDVAAGDPCDDDAFEDNDFRDMATPLTAGLHTGLRGCDVDQDCYTIPMTAGQTLSLTLDATMPEGAWAHRRVGLFPPSGEVARSEGTENPVALEVTSGTDGQAVIEVRFWADDVDYSMDLRYGE
jgi:hypothetical protein